jgi:hypothetical protein
LQQNKTKKEVKENLYKENEKGKVYWNPEKAS